MVRNADRPRLRPRFTIRTLLLLTLLVAMALGWRASLRSAGQQLGLQTIQLRYAEEELQRARDDVRELRLLNRPDGRVFFGPQLDGARLSDEGRNRQMAVA